MDQSQVTLDVYEINNFENYNDVINLLNQERRWELVVNDLKLHRNIIFNEVVMRQMASSCSPAQVLFNELKIRLCKVGQLNEILHISGMEDAVFILTGTGELKIVEQPGENDQLFQINQGGELRLKCRAIGRLPLSYQWYRYNIPLTGLTEPELAIKDFREEHVGEYYCIISHYRQSVLKEIYSNTVQCQLMETPPIFLNQPPTELSLCSGDHMQLVVEISSQCELQWIKNNTVLQQGNNNIFEILCVEESHEGKYRCMARNSAGEVFSNECTLKVYPEKNKGSAKVALLIGNEIYDEHKPLKTPCNDVVLLSKILKKLRFHVITLINLSLSEMEAAVLWFFNILPQNAYAFFYYAGHGFEIFKNKFMMPVDCPKFDELRMADCLCEEKVIKYANNKKIKLDLLVIILDMCLKCPSRDENPGIHLEGAPNFEYPLNDNCKLIQAYATSPHQSAYENPEEDNGIYMEYLSKHLCQDKPLIEILGQAHKELHNDSRVKQKPNLHYDIVEKFKLTDHKYGDGKLLRNIDALTKIPRNHKLYFHELDLESQVVVKPHKEHVLNAIDILFDKTLSQWAISAEVNPEVLNQYKWTMENDGCSVLTLYNLQKVRGEVFITVKLNVKLNNMKDRSTFHIVGNAYLDLEKPLIVKLKLWYQQPSSTTST